MRIHETRRIPAVENLQTPGQGGFPAVELLVEIVAQSADRLRQDESRSQRIAERGQRDSTAPTADPRADPAEEHRAPNAQPAVPDTQRRAEAGTARSPIRLP